MLEDIEVDEVAAMVVDSEVDKVVDKPHCGGGHQRGSHSLSAQSQAGPSRPVGRPLARSWALRAPRLLLVQL